MTRFRFYLLALLLVAVASAPARAQHCAMAQSIHYTSTIGNVRLVTDPLGNTYYAGCFQGILDVAGTQIIPAPGDNSVNLYVAKFNATGQLLWLKHGGSPTTEVTYAMALDGIGGLYVTGTNGQGFEFGGTTLDSAGTYLMKFDTGTGALAWARLVGNSTFTAPNTLRGIGVWSLAANSTGLYFGGVAELNSSIDGVPLQTTSFGGGFGRTALVAKCTLGGVVTAVWQGVPLMDSTLMQTPFIALDPNGEVVVAGGYTRTVQFGTAVGSPVHTATLLSPISQVEHFLLRLSLAVPGGTTLSVMPRLPWLTALSTDAHGDCYISGYSPRDAIGNVAVADSGMYVARLSRQGTVRWVASVTHTAGHGPVIIPHGVLTDPNGRLYVHGRINALSAQFGAYTVAANGGAFYACYDSTGVVQWARCADNPTLANADIPQGLAIDAANRLYAGGVSYTSPTGPPSRYDGLAIRSGSAYLLRFDPAAEVSGHAYLDQNANGQRDTGEPAFPRPVLVEEVTSTATTTTDATGLYHALLLPSAYDLQVNAPAYYTVTAPLNNRHSGTLTAFGQVQSGRDFGIAPTPNRPDVRVTLTPYSNARSGFANRYRVRVENLGTTTVASGQASVAFDPATSYVGAFPAPNHYTATSATWNFQNLAPFAILNFDVASTVPITVPLGTIVRSRATVTVTGGDLDLTNNVDSVQQAVTGAFDPNDLTVNHTDLSPAQVAAGTPLEYTIRFQNLGTDTAFSVTITDTLPANLLRLGTLYPVSASHNCSVELAGNNQVIIRFDNIRLPPNSTSVLNSMGFVRFEVAPSAALQPGALIPNKAHIVFDYNTPVATNEVQTLVQNLNGLAAEPGATALSLYPNPTDHAATVTVTAEVPTAGVAQVLITDILGRPIRQEQAQAAAGEWHYAVPTADLKPGVYGVRLTLPGGNRASRKLVVR